MAVTSIGTEDLENTITFGKHKGVTWDYAINSFSNYVLWCNENVKFIKLSPEVVALAEYQAATLYSTAGNSRNSKLPRKYRNDIPIWMMECGITHTRSMTEMTGELCTG